jgi:hypothetical protein
VRGLFRGWARVSMTVVKRVLGHHVLIGGEQHSGWLPEGATTPLPIPIRDVAFNIELQFDGSGYRLCYVSEEGDLFGDTWHQTLEDAERAAAENFHVRDDQWQPGA